MSATVSVLATFFSTSTLTRAAFETLSPVVQAALAALGIAAVGSVLYKGTTGSILALANYRKAGGIAELPDGTQGRVHRIYSDRIDFLREDGTIVTLRGDALKAIAEQDVKGDAEALVDVRKEVAEIRKGNTGTRTYERIVEDDRALEGWERAAGDAQASAERAEAATEAALSGAEKAIAEQKAASDAIIASLRDKFAPSTAPQDTDATASPADPVEVPAATPAAAQPMTAMEAVSNAIAATSPEAEDVTPEVDAQLAADAKAMVDAAPSSDAAVDAAEKVLDAEIEAAPAKPAKTKSRRSRKAKTVKAEVVEAIPAAAKTVKAAPAPEAEATPSDAPAPQASPETESGNLETADEAAAS